MIDPQSLNLASLPWLPLDARSAFPRQSAIYFAIDSQNNVQYVGIAKDPKVRWGNHHRYGQLQSIGGIRIAYLFVDDATLLRPIEDALIAWFDPPLNVIGRKVARQSRPSSRKKLGARRRTFNLGKDLCLKLRKVAHKEDSNCTEILEEAMRQFFSDYEKQNRIKIDQIEIPGEDD